MKNRPKSQKSTQKPKIELKDKTLPEIDPKAKNHPKAKSLPKIEPIAKTLTKINPKAKNPPKAKNRIKRQNSTKN